MNETPCILLVEDDLVLRELVRRTLFLDGILAVGVDTGEQALRMVGKVRFDLVVADVDLPGLDGVEMARRIWARHPGFPVIFTTGFDEALARARGVLDLSPGILEKPFEMDRLLGVVWHVLGGRPPSLRTCQDGTEPVRGSDGMAPNGSPAHGTPVAPPRGE